MADTMEETEFKAFCDELKKETPDMDKIKAGMEKYGMGQLSDAQKAIFQAAMFPAPVAEGAKESEKLGFQNLNGIKNALTAMQQLQTEGKVNNEQMKMFLTEPNPENGKSIMTTVALETRAVEFKSKHIEDTSTKAILDKNKEVTTAIQETLGKLDYELLRDAANTPDATKPEPKKYTNYVKTSQGQQSQLNDSLKKSAESHPLEIIAEEESVKVGGNENAEPLKVDSKAKPLDVKAKANPEEQNEEDKPDKVATLDDGGNDPKNGKGDWHFSPVEEQDIINYMFKAWVIGGLNAGLEGTFTFADWLVRAATGGVDRTPQASAVASNNSGNAGAGGSGGSRSSSSPSGRGAAYAGEIVKLGERSIQSYNEIMAGGNKTNSEEYLAVLTRNIKNNIGKNPKDWVCETVTTDGVTTIPLDPKKNKDFIEALNDHYKKDPEGFKRFIEKMPKTMKGLNTSFMQNIMVSACHMQALDEAYFREAPKAGGAAKQLTPLEQLKVVIPNAKIGEFLETVQQIEKKNRLETLGDANKKPTAEEQKKIAEAVQKEFLEYMKDVGTKANNLRDFVAEYHEEQDPTKKTALKKQMEAARKEYEDTYNKYRNPNGEEGRDKQAKDDKKKDKPMGADEAAHEEERAREKDRKRVDSVNKDSAEIEASREDVKKKKERVAETKKRTGHDKSNTQQQTSSRVRAMASLPRRRRGMGEMGE